MNAYPVLERDEELSLIMPLFDDAAAGGARAAFIVGDAGMGKTRLAQEIAAWAEAVGARSVWGKAWILATPHHYGLG